MLASAALLGAVCMVTSIAFSAVFRMKAHTESTLITAGLLFFILPPSLTPTGLGGARARGG